MLKVEKLNVFYSELHALSDVAIEVRERDLLALIGSNGAGKTTLVKTISGLLQASTGSILFQGDPIEKEPTARICGRGIVQVPEGRKLFPQMSVRENLEMGAYLHHAKEQTEEGFREVFSLFPVLAERHKQLAGTLSGGEQQMLALGRALMAKPKLLMLDEPTLGLSPLIAAEIYRIVTKLHDAGMTILLVSQDVFHALKIAQRAAVLENGRMIMEDSGQALLRNPRVKEAYLGI